MGRNGSGFEMIRPFLCFTILLATGSNLVLCDQNQTEVSQDMGKEGDDYQMLWEQIARDQLRKMMPEIISTLSPHIKEFMREAMRDPAVRRELAIIVRELMRDPSFKPFFRELVKDLLPELIRELFPWLRLGDSTASRRRI